MKPKTMTFFVELSLHSGEGAERTRKNGSYIDGDIPKRPSGHDGKLKQSWVRKIRGRLCQHGTNTARVEPMDTAGDDLISTPVRPRDGPHHHEIRPSNVNTSANGSSAVRLAGSQGAGVIQRARELPELPNASSGNGRLNTEPTSRQQEASRHSRQCREPRRVQIFTSVLTPRVRSPGNNATIQASVSRTRETRIEFETLDQTPDFLTAPNETDVPRLGGEISGMLNASTDTTPCSAPRKSGRQSPTASTDRSGSTTSDKSSSDTSDPDRRVAEDANERRPEQYTRPHDLESARPCDRKRLQPTRADHVGLRASVEGTTDVVGLVAPKSSLAHERAAVLPDSTCLTDIRAAISAQQTLMDKLQRLEARLRGASDSQMRKSGPPLERERQRRQDLQKAYHKAADNLGKAQLRFDTRDECRQRDKIENVGFLQDPNGSQGLAPEDFDLQWVNMIGQLAKDLSNAEKTYRKARRDAIKGGCDLVDEFASSIFDNRESECYPPSWEAGRTADVDRPRIEACIAAQPAIIESARDQAWKAGNRQLARPGPGAVGKLEHDSQLHGSGQDQQLEGNLQSFAQDVQSHAMFKSDHFEQSII